MKNKGFTLIELLAIIVILAIIALITLPVVKNVIDQAKEKTAINSAYGFKDALHDYYINSTLDDETELEGIYRISDGMIDGPNLSNVSIKVKGTKPTAGKVIYKNGEILTACLEINGYKIKYNNEQFTSEGKGSCAASAANFATDSWAEIKFNLEADREAYPIGSLKTIKLDLDGTEKDYTLRLVNVSHPEPQCSAVNIAGNMTFSQTGCGVVIEFVTLTPSQKFNDSNTSGGWASSSLRTYLNTGEDSFYNKLPDDLKAVIIETTPIASGKADNSSNSNGIAYTYGDKIFLLSLRELGISNTSLDQAYNNTRVLDFYTTNGTNARKKYVSGNNTTTYKYWTRTQVYTRSDKIWYIKADGSNGDYSDLSTTSSVQIAPAFRIAE